MFNVLRIHYISNLSSLTRFHIFLSARTHFTFHISYYTKSKKRNWTVAPKFAPTFVCCKHASERTVVNCYSAFYRHLDSRTHIREKKISDCCIVPMILLLLYLFVGQITYVSSYINNCASQSNFCLNFS